MRQSSTLLVVFLMGTGLLMGQPPNLSVKVGGIIPCAQLLFGSRSAGGRTSLPTVGLGYYSMYTKYEESNGEDYDSDLSIRLLLPRVGIRLLSQQYGGLQSYVALEGFALIPLVSGEDLEKDDEEELEDALNVLGLTIGYGAEYFFSHQFSLGGEVTYNWVYQSTEYESDYDSYSSKTLTTISAVLTQMALNYYFK